MRSCRRSHPLLVAALLLTLATQRLPAAEGEPAPAPLLTLGEVKVSPVAPTAKTLCHLEVQLKNSGTAPASSLRFVVSVAGKELPVYANQVFMQEVPAGQTTTVKLYNFWASETGRPAPADGKLKVEVTLAEAKWMKIETDAEGVEVWQPLDAVPGLPQTQSVTLALKP